MNPDIKRLWVTALLSGEYPQSTDYLRDESGWCCLGVLADQYLKSSHMDRMPWVLTDSDSYHSDDCFCWDHSDGDDTEDYDCGCRPHHRIRGLSSESDANDVVLPPEVVEWAGLAGLDACNPIVRIPCGSPGGTAQKVALSELNDQLRWDFKRIAGVIDAQL